MSNELSVATNLDEKTQIQLIKKSLACSDDVPEEEIRMATAWCQMRKLDILKKPIAIVPFKNKKTGKTSYQVFPTAEAVKTIAKRGGWCGNGEYVYGPTKKFTWNDYGSPVTVEAPEWGQVSVYAFIDGQRCEFTGPKVYFQERNQKNSNWLKQPITMLNKCILSAALRNAFPEELGGIFISEEAQEMKSFSVVEPEKPQIPQLPKNKKPYFKKKDQIVEVKAKVVEDAPAPDYDPESEKKALEILQEIASFSELEANDANREVVEAFVGGMRETLPEIQKFDPTNRDKVYSEMKKLKFDWEIE